MSCESSKLSATPKEPWWFKEGLRFSCVEGCARCCGGAPGDVFVNQQEMEAIAARMSLSLAEFERKYIRHYASGKRSIKEHRNGDCLLLNENGKGCSVYEDRPSQCREYPFWPELLATPADWLKETQRCPGLNEGVLYEGPQIVEMVRKQEEA